MTDTEFKATFVLDIDPEVAFKRLTQPVEGAPKDGDKIHLIAGFPSFVPTPAPGALCTEIDAAPGHLLRLKKNDEPCAGTEIVIVLEQQSTGTRVTVTQSGFGPWFDDAKDTVVAHGREIVTDLQLYLQTGYRAPPKNWGIPFGADTASTDVGLILKTVYPEGPLDKAGLKADDLLITFKGVRIYDIRQLWTVLGVTGPGETIDVTWLRSREPMAATVQY